MCCPKHNVSNNHTLGHLLPVRVGPVPLASLVQCQLIPSGTLDYHFLIHQIPREEYT